MSAFENLVYVSRSGVTAPVDRFHPDCPYNVVGSGGPVARAVMQDGGLTDIAWNYRGQHISKRFGSPVIASVDPGTGLMVVVLHYSDTAYPRPHNAIAVRLDGTLDHQITPPAWVAQTTAHPPGGSPTIENFPVEAIKSATVKDGRTLIDLNFRYEWIEARYYDVASRQWQEREQISRL